MKEKKNNNNSINSKTKSNKKKTIGHSLYREHKGIRKTTKTTPRAKLKETIYHIEISFYIYECIVIFYVFGNNERNGKITGNNDIVTLLRINREKNKIFTILLFIRWANDKETNAIYFFYKTKKNNENKK